MSQADVSSKSDGTSDAEGIAPTIDRGTASKAANYVRRGVKSGGVAGVIGGMGVLRGLREIRRGERGRGLARLLAGGLLVAVAAAQRRAAAGRDGGRHGGDRVSGGRADVDQTDVVDTGPDIETVSEGAEPGDRLHASGDEAAAVVEDAGPSPELESDAESADVDQTDVVDTGIDETELEDVAAEASVERLGAAAFDQHSRRVPVPQRAFNLDILALGSEVFWGVREADDAVVLSQLYDPIQEGDGVRYVGSSEVDDDRIVTIPDVVVNHWDDVGGGGTAVAGGDEIVFATTDALRADNQLLVVPERWADEVLGAGE